MDKNKIRGIITLAIVLIVFSVIAFVVPFTRGTGFWLAYVCGVIAILFQVYIYSITFGSAKDARSRFYGFPIVRIGATYLGAQMLISFIEMIFGSLLPAWVIVVINVIVLAAAVVGCIAADAMRDEVSHQDVKLNKAVNKMRTLQSIALSLVTMCEGEETRKVVKNVSEEFKYSDPVSSPRTEPLEDNLEQELKDLQKTIIDGDNEAVVILCEKLMENLKVRNRECALSKRD